MSTETVLFGESLRAEVTRWLEEVGKTDRDRFLKLLKLSTAPKIRLSDALDQLFPGEDTQTALANLTRLRKRLNDAADGDQQAKPDLGLRFHVDTKKKSPPSERRVWFTGPDAAVRRVTQFSQEVTADVAGKPLINAKGIATTGSAMAGRKRVVRFFISYAHENKVLAEALVKGLRSQFKPSKNYELEFWNDREIMVGEKWHQRILQAITECHFGLFMVSPDFLGSDYIGENEIPPFVSGESCKPIIPVGLVPVSFDRHDLKGLEENQLFFLRGRTFDQMRQATEKTEFARHLHEEMEKRLDAYFSQQTDLDPNLRPSAPLPLRGKNEHLSALDFPQRSREATVNDPQHLSPEDALRLMRTPEETRHFQRTRGFAHHLSEREALDPAKAHLGEARDALDELEAWAVRTEGSSFFALLGEVGIGKTTTLKQFTRLLIDKRGREPGPYPLPIYIDLRDYVGDRPGAVPTIEELLTSVIQRSWRVTDRTVTAADLLRLVREEGALIIFDGLDEKIVHLTQDRARDFIRTLWSALPPTAQKSGKLLLSCRSHYFRDVWSQNAMLTGEDREGIDRSQYPAFCLLPFDERQIRDYLVSFLGDAKRGGEAFDLIASIHNLRDLAERPYLLSLISSRLDELEALKMRGETVNAARLYDLVVRSWLSRDDGKHQLDAAHKRRLMEALAAALWRSGEKQWDVDRLEDWLDDFLHQSPALAAAYANKDRSLLKEDLRTATFVLRPDTEESHFRFAHTSLQEYFLACHLARALKEKADAQWDMPIASLETLDFLGQILALEPQTASIQSLERLLGSDCLPAATMAFQYWLQAIQHGHPEPQPKHVNLAGANFDECRIRGHAKDRALNLRGANLRGVQLNRARVEFVDLSEADLTGLEARQALFLHVDVSHAKLENADVAGLQWRHGSLEGADFPNVSWDQCEWVHVAGQSLFKFHDMRLRAKADMCYAKVFMGHTKPVNQFAWNPAGTAIATCSDDRNLCIWEAQTGRELLRLTGHTDAVQTCAWSPDGAFLASGSNDRTIRIWQISTGTEEKRLTGHTHGISCSAWSPDGKRLLSGSFEGDVLVWDLEKMALLRKLEAHSAEVTKVEWHPGGRRFLSTSYDETIKIWDSTDGSMSLLMKHPVFAVETRWEQSGEKILSGGWDDQVIVWNARNGEPYAKLGTGHESIYSCSWTADGCRFAITSLSGELEVWDAGFSRRIMVIKDTTSHFVSCLMSRDGLSVLTSNSNHHLELWSVPNGQRLLFFRANTSYAQKIDPDGSLRHTLPYDQCCVISNDGKRILHATPEAWRWLGWEERDAKGRFIRRLPAEAFGPIPGMDD
jgi:uncharacterized protein YjbI with pentapeptide repeats